MNLVSDGDLTWRPFGVDTDPDKIRKKFPELFAGKDTVYANITAQGVILRSVLSSVLFIKSERRNEVEVTDTEQDVTDTTGIILYRAEIRDPIVIARGLIVGMSKKVFFEEIFSSYDSSLFSGINVITNSDPSGEGLEVHFMFNNGILEEIRMQPPY